MDMNKLRIFHRVVEEGSFSAAGRALYLSQPSVSAHIKDLEREAGLPLFERVGRGVRPTPAGETLADYARRIFALQEDAEQAIAAHRGAETGRVVVAASSTPGTYVLPPILGRFHDEHPGVEVRLEISDTAAVERRLLSLEADLGVTGEPIHPGGLEIRRWIPDELVLIVASGHPWAARPPRKAEALRGEPFVSRERGSSIRALTDAWLEERKIEVNRVMELGSPEAVNSAVAAGLGVAFTSRFAIEDKLAAGQLDVVRLPGLPIRRRLNVITNREKRLLPAPRRLLEMILASPGRFGRAARGPTPGASTRPRPRPGRAGRASRSKGPRSGP